MKEDMTIKEQIWKLVSIKEIKPKYTHQEIANIVGVTRQYVSQVLLQDNPNVPKKPKKDLLAIKQVIV